MQSLEIISVNVWQIVISLCNLALLSLALKHFLYKPVRAAMDKRQAAVDALMRDAETARDEAEASRASWQAKLDAAGSEAEGIVRTAVAEASDKGNAIIADARANADRITRQARQEAEAERQRMAESVRGEIIDVSYALAEKVLAREINQDDQRALVDSFLDGLESESDN